ncbi:MAG: hypothetical protein QOE90_2029 [Thermoplasmata archaeon]|jgi:hypothetical protein|nr:hypothetical protein [Thermoplasmata archaeon]
MVLRSRIGNVEAQSRRCGVVPGSRTELDGVVAMIPAKVGTGGRISGFSDYVGRRVLVVIQDDLGDSAPKRRKGGGGR